MYIYLFIYYLFITYILIYSLECVLSYEWTERLRVRERWRKIAAAKKCSVATRWSTHTSEMTSHVRVRSVLDESRRAVKHVRARARARFLRTHGNLPPLTVSHTALAIRVTARAWCEPQGYQCFLGVKDLKEKNMFDPSAKFSIYCTVYLSR